MKFTFFMLSAALSIVLLFVSCSKDHTNSVPPLATTALYDTLGWFVQGANLSMPIARQGIKMIDDPANSGQKIQAGRLAIRSVVDSAIFIIAADPKMTPYFPTLLSEVGAGNLTGFTHLSETFSDFIQQAVSGQQIYKGLSMAQAHNHATFFRFGSTNHPTADSADFDAFVTDVASAASEKLHVPGSVIAQLGTLLYSTEKDVVQDKAK